ncbi:MoaF-related domain-containing protein [Nocardia sp. CA-107356]|uniref:MoaF-related domain-containing protein n=1 Tax=Nocardia sp. CA-107356 TaxID=3239972 RepID=UPI003D8E3FDF
MTDVVARRVPAESRVRPHSTEERGSSMALRIFGSCFLAYMDDYVAVLRYESDTSLTITVLEGAGLADAGHRESVETTMAELRPGLFFSTWRERSGTVVAQIADFPNGVVRAVAMPAGGEAVILAGTLRLFHAVCDE